MYASIVLASTLGAAVVFASPSYPDLTVNGAMPGSLDAVSDYFNLLAQKVQEARWMPAAPVCDMSKAQLPLVEGLPPASTGLTLKHIAIGRGTQNYTCDLANSTAVPTLAGATATLFNASCVGAAYPDLLAMLPRVALQFNLSSSDPGAAPQRMGPSNLVVSGHHFFTNATTPFFELDSSPQQIGTIPCAKNGTAPAPADAAKGQQGDAAVAWLKLVARPGATGQLQEVYRVQTAGGSAPAKCDGLQASFTVQYAAQYWFFEGQPSS